MNPEPNPYPHPAQQPPPFPPPGPAVRVQPPSVAMTVVITLFFGVFGLIAAASSASKATQLGYPTGKYWVTWLVIMSCWFLLLFAAVSGL